MVEYVFILALIAIAIAIAVVAALGRAVSTKFSQAPSGVNGG